LHQKLDVEGPATQRSVLDVLKARYPMLRGTICDEVTKQRRPFVRFFACPQDLSLELLHDPMPDAVVSGEPFFVGKKEKGLNPRENHTKIEDRKTG